jgi:enoyl-CoA hydratase/carnithine racemase
MDDRVVVLTGGDGYFSSGGDLTEATTPEMEAGRFEDLAAVANSLPGNSRPVIAAVEGGAFGVGLSLVAACDYVVTASDARFGAPFVKVGLTGDGGVTWSLPRRVGQAHARSLLLGAAPIDAVRAETIGLVNEVVQSGTALTRAVEVAASWATAAPLALAATKRALFLSDCGLAEALEREARDQRRLVATDDAAEARSAFREKRNPEFKGR